VNETFEENRGLMFSIAYRMLGSAAEAEDIVQEAYLRYQAMPPENIQSHKAFLSTIVTRLSIDHLKSAKVQRETYFGQWLPEPLLTQDDTLESSVDYDSISIAFLVLLESLTPAERAVFLLHEVFDYSYEEIAHIVDKDMAACRQLLSRAKKHIHARHHRFQTTAEKHHEIILKFALAAQAGELDELTTLLAEDIEWHADGGGKVPAVIRPLHGREKVARLVVGLPRFLPEGSYLEINNINGQPCLVVYYSDGKPHFVFFFTVEDGKIRQVWVMANPDKLKRIHGSN